MAEPFVYLYLVRGAVYPNCNLHGYDETVASSICSQETHDVEGACMKYSRQASSTILTERYTDSQPRVGRDAHGTS